MAEEKEEKKPKILPLLYFEKQGLSIRPWMIHSMEKRNELISNMAGVFWKYSIVLNAGLEPSADIPVGEKILYFEDDKEERDNKYELILMTLEELNNKVIRL
jgi:hypothetical protein